MTQILVDRLWALYEWPERSLRRMSLADMRYEALKTNPFPYIEEAKMHAALLLALSGCLYVSTTGDPAPDPTPGLMYTCTWRFNGSDHDKQICGPSPPDPDYVVNHFFPAMDNGTFVTCAVTVELCLFTPEP